MTRLCCRDFLCCALLILLQLTPAQGSDKIPLQPSEQFSECYKIKQKPVLFENIKRIIESPPCFKQPFITTLKEYFLVCYFPEHYRNPVQECYRSQHIIRGAVEMYNLEHKPPIRRINDEMLSSTFTPLIPEYLKHPFPKAEKNCHFYSIGDITEGKLFIFCIWHGSPQSIEELEAIYKTVKQKNSRH
jgi:hypothetical protein